MEHSRDDGLPWSAHTRGHYLNVLRYHDPFAFSPKAVLDLTDKIKAAVGKSVSLLELVQQTPVITTLINDCLGKEPIVLVSSQAQINNGVQVWIISVCHIVRH